MVTATLSDRGAGSGVAIRAATTPAGAVLTSAWTVPTVVGEPPPYTNVWVPSLTADASWTATGSWRRAAWSTPAVVYASMVGTDEPEASSPPSTVNPPGDETTASRDTALASCQGSRPASIDGIERAVRVGVDVPPTNWSMPHANVVTTRRVTSKATIRRLRYTRRRSAILASRLSGRGERWGCGVEVGIRGDEVALRPPETVELSGPSRRLQPYRVTDLLRRVLD